MSKLRALLSFWIEKHKLASIQNAQRKEQAQEEEEEEEREEGLGPVLDWSSSIDQQKILLREIAKQEASLRKKFKKLSKSQSYAKMNELLECKRELKAQEQERRRLQGIIVSLETPRVIV
ncbi:uncharacterized protein N7511_004205 [Penicillium nucicola]|uniref:uncharacterized protein n=1 Tax=Penicillium nucicola TaxID=1850975 RepID=UPI00254500E3|nr:uncharacterized protein N7511_004205 [Penicillium nucicola]KAJ5766589.1 hypothetical protein N7511_004205 [Penicillium nucicola]